MNPSHIQAGHAEAHPNANRARWYQLLSFIPEPNPSPLALASYHFVTQSAEPCKGFPTEDNSTLQGQCPIISPEEGTLEAHEREQEEPWHVSADPWRCLHVAAG